MARQSRSLPGIFAERRRINRSGKRRERDCSLEQTAGENEYEVESMVP